MFDKSNTFLNSATGSYSSIDLNLYSPDKYLGFSRKVEDELHGRDHFPIILLEIGPSVQEKKTTKWKLHKA